MKYIDDAIEYITLLSEKDFKRQLGIILGIASLSAFGLVYYIYSKSASYQAGYKQLISQVQKTKQIMQENAVLQREEDRIQDMLEKNRDFSLKSYFEQFYREHKITPEPNWDTTINPIEGNEAFEEVILPATFRNETTKKLVRILDDLDKKEIVYLKELVIKKEEEKTITFEITLATKKMRRIIEE